MLVALASATAIAILLPAGPDDGCPSPHQVRDAVAAHLPGVVQPLGRPPGPGALRLSVTSDGTGTLRVDLSDPEGGPLLRRRVAPETAARTKAAECVALAETAALIVDRYWHEVGYEVPPAPPVVAPKPAPPPKPPVAPKPAVEPKPVVEPPSAPEPAAPEPPARAAEPSKRDSDNEPPPPREPERLPERPRAPLRPPSWWLAAGIGGDAGDKGQPRPRASLAIAVEKAALGRRVGLRFSTSGRYPEGMTWTENGAPAGQATLWQFPVAMDAYLAIPIGFGRLEPGLGVALNVIDVTSTRGNAQDSKLAAAPEADLSVAWTVPLPHDVFLRTRAAGGVGVPITAVDDDFRSTNDAPAQRLLETPRFHGELGLELGVWFY
ncbi:MAG TPA: hypothetical protein VHM31_00105 [Polyangia bacterium]|nr:hypothetical protein [Polyangia bacterium]